MTHRIHVDNIFNEEISLETVDTVTVDHDLVPTGRTLELPTGNAHNTAAAVVTFFGALSA